jgi:hypothetical protein
MKRLSFIALLFAAPLLAWAGVNAAQGPAGVAESKCGCVECRCPNCNGEFCSCDKCECGTCGCAKAEAAPAAKSCCAPKQA